VTRRLRSVWRATGVARRSFVAVYFPMGRRWDILPDDSRWPQISIFKNLLNHKNRPTICRSGFILFATFYLSRHLVGFIIVIYTF
jgi:hypothetical protein